MCVEENPSSGWNRGDQAVAVLVCTTQWGAVGLPPGAGYQQEGSEGRMAASWWAAGELDSRKDSALLEADPRLCSDCLKLNQ